MTLRLDAVGKEFTPGRPVLADLDLTVAAGEFVCVVGASGSGKSTLLSLVAGLTRPTTGRVLLDGAEVTGPGPERGLVFQTDTLYPWRGVARNVAFGLEALGVPRRERDARVARLLEEVGLTGKAAALPGTLSGGQRQRVAIARALACSPRVLLLDEPFGALDVQTKEDMQVFVRQVWRDEPTTVIMVTHDVEEAVFLGGRVLVLSCDPGRIAKDLTVDLPAERTLELKRSAAFAGLRAEVEDLVRAEHRAHQARV